MEENQPKTGKFAWIYGLLTAGVGIIFTLMLMSMDMLYDQSIGKTIVGIVILAGFIFLAIFNYRKANGGLLNLKTALKVGVGTALVAGIISVIFTYLLINFMVPDFWEKSAEVTRATIQEQNPKLTSDQVENAIEMQQKFAWITYPAILIFNVFIGFIISLLGGLALKKTENVN